MNNVKIQTIDCHYIEPEFAASYLVTHNGEAALIDNGTRHSVPYLLHDIKKEGLSLNQIQWIIITHVHLDHAAGSSELMKHCPNAKLVCHPRAERHIVDPSKLEGSARTVYGNETFDRLYGKLESIPQSRVQTQEDLSQIKLGLVDLVFHHTRGHAKHHFCIEIPSERAVFTGDMFGLYYPLLQSHGFFIFPSTSPTDYEPDEALTSISKIESLNPKVLYPTHFGPIYDVSQAASQMREHYTWAKSIYEAALIRVKNHQEIKEWCRDQWLTHFKFLRPWTPEQWKLMAMDLRINGDGMAYAALKNQN